MSETNGATRHENIYDALAAAQGEFSEITKSKTANVQHRGGGSHSYNYADLAEVLSATRPHLSRHGLSVSWVFRPGDRQGEVVTQLLHHSGKLESPIPVFYDTGGVSAMQALGSALTYAKRYGLCGLIGVAAEDDDDGAGAGTPPRQEPRSNGSSKQESKPANKAAAPKQDAPKTEAGKTNLQLKLDANKDPAELVAAFQKCVEAWPEKTDLLGETYEYIAALNRSRVVAGFKYDNVGQEQAWDDEDRKWVHDELNKIASTIGSKPAESTSEPTEEPPTGDWFARIEAITKSDHLFGLISEAADDGDLTADPDKFQQVCMAISAKLDAHSMDWGDGVVAISRQHLTQRITAVEMDRSAKEATSNATAS